MGEEVLQHALHLYPAQLVVFVQMQADEAAVVFIQYAKDVYYLTPGDLAPLTHQLKRNPLRRSAPQRLYNKQVRQWQRLPPYTIGLC